MNSIVTQNHARFQAESPTLLARLVARPFHLMLDRIHAGLEQGAIEANLPDGSFRVLGGRQPGPLARVDLRSWRALVRLSRGGSAGWYEAWAAGEWASADPVPLICSCATAQHWGRPREHPG
jgi:cyclopropane-fatty-acyl-phospholipid synthase